MIKLKSKLDAGMWILLIALMIVHLFSIRATNAATAIYTYDNLNRIKKIDFGNGATISYAYDDMGNRITLESTPSDTTPPIIETSVAPLPNSAGWHNTNVTVTYSCSDNETGIATCPTPAMVSSEGASQVISGTAFDKAGNGASTSVTINLDKTSPAINPTLSPSPNSNGWNNTDVIVTFDCIDSLSGITSCTAPVTVTTEGASQIINGSAVDMAGNNAPTTAMVNIDKIHPVITASLSSPSNTAGWHNADVTVTFSCTDTVSGIASCPDPVNVSTEGAGQVITGTATDKAGNNASASVMINLDKTPPVLTMPVLASSNIYNAPVTFNFSSMDGLSGIAVSSATLNGIPINSGDTINVTTVWANTYMMTATDLAGNMATQTATFDVIYDYSGVLPPVNADGTSIFKLGRPIPVKFQLKDYYGSYVSTATAKIYVAKIANSVIGSELEASSTSAADSGNTFRYDSLANQYIFNLNTKNLSNGTWQIRIDLGDGTQRTVLVSLKL